MENTQNLNNFDGLIDPSTVNNVPNKNQIKEIKVVRDGLLERTTKKVVTNDGRQLLDENGNIINVL